MVRERPEASRLRTGDGRFVSGLLAADYRWPASAKPFGRMELVADPRSDSARLRE